MITAEGDQEQAVVLRLGTKEFETYSRSLDKRSLGYRFVKRLFDIVFSVFVIAVCILLLPLTLLLLVVIAIQTKASPIYIQKRVGKYGRPMRIFKLRSMVGDSDNVEKYFDDDQLVQWRKERKVENDSRVVPIGRFIRKTSIDEFANVLNVLAGEIPSRILKTRRGFSLKKPGAFALPARLARTRIAASLQVRVVISAITGVPQNLFEYFIAGYGEMREVFAKRDSRIDFPLRDRSMPIPCNGLPI